MYQQRAHAGIAGHCARTLDGILKQGSTEFDALCSPINRQTPQYQHGNGIRHIAAHSTGCRLVGNGACSQRVVAHHLLALIGHDKYPARTGNLVGERPALEPIVQNGLARREIRDEMSSD